MKQLITSICTLLLLASFLILPAKAHDAVIIFGADNNVITEFRVILKSTGGDRIVRQYSTSDSRYAVTFSGIKGRVRTIAFWLLNDNDPRANGKDVNLIIRHVFVDSIEVYPSILYDNGIVVRQCKRDNNGSPPPDCPRTYRDGKSMVLPWNNVRYKLLNLEVIEHPVDQSHRELFCQFGAHCYLGQRCIDGWCVRQCTKVFLNGEGLTSNRPNDWVYNSDKDYDFRSTECVTGKTYSEALDFAFELTGRPKSDFTETLYNYDTISGQCVPVEWKASNGDEINVDIPEIYHPTGSGPKQRHIGYKYGGKNKKVGHIFIDDDQITASRPTPGTTSPCTP